VLLVEDLDAMPRHGGETLHRRRAGYANPDDETIKRAEAALET
jgi:hypothetical protein